MNMTHEAICGLFEGAGDFVSRQLRCGDHTLYCYSIDGLVSGSDISAYVLKPITECLAAENMGSLYEKALAGAIYNAVAKPCPDLKDVSLKLVNGFCVILFPGAGALAFEVKTSEKRSISPPDLENTAKGAKDAFVETLRTNTSLLRRHLRTPDLRLRELSVGNMSQTAVSVVWIEGVTKPAYVSKMLQRISSLKSDAFLTPAAVEEAITGSRFTVFPLLQYTQRTDRFCKGLMEGRVGLFVDGIPLGYLAPVDIGYLMDSAEDYSRDFISASCVRVLRYVALLLDLLLPAIYIAMTAYHFDWLPQSIAQVIQKGREAVPFSPIWETLTLLVAFELLQESGVHLPRSIGQSVSIIGGIVVGTVGVEAGLISSIALIAVSISGVCGFVLPNRDLADGIRVCRFLLGVAASIFGLWGMVGGILLLALHLIKLKSLDQPYVKLFEPHLLRRRIDRK